MIDPITLLKMLSDETRLSALYLIHKEQELCVCELVEAMNESQPKISRHLALLRDQGILSTRRAKQWVFYSLNNQLPSWTQTIFSTLFEQSNNSFQAMLERLHKMGDRPNRQLECC